MDILKVAQSQLGISEFPINSNEGPEIEKYFKAVGFERKIGWCFAFVYWCVSEVLKDQNPLVKSLKPMDTYKLFKENKKLVADPKIGDIFIMENNVAGVGHAGFVERFFNDGTILTIEGNTKEGNVARKVRKLSEIKAFISI